MQINSLPAGGAVGAGELEVSPVTLYTKQLRSQTLLYQTLHARLNENDIQNFLKTVGFHQKYSDIKTPALGFDFETWRAQPSILPTSQPFEQLCSPNEPFVVVLEKGFFLNEISSFGVDFESCNFVDLFMPEYTHYTD